MQSLGHKQVKISNAPGQLLYYTVLNINHFDNDYDQEQKE